MNRRTFLALSGWAAGAAALEAKAAAFPHFQKQAKADVTLRIAPLDLEIGQGKLIKTVAYNGSVPGPIVRLREGKPVTVEVFNDTDIPEVVHWHGQKISSEVDGSLEEGTPAVPPRGRRSFRFVPQPAGTRWYHTHVAAGPNLDLGGYSGQFGFAIIEPAHHPGDYDQEICLAVHHWGLRWRTWARPITAGRSPTSTPP